MNSAFERRLRILEYLKAKGRATSKELSEIFGVSQTTIKKDMMFLSGSDVSSRAGRGGCFAYTGPKHCMLSRTEYYVLKNLLKQHSYELSTDFSDRLLDKLSKLMESDSKGQTH